MGTRTYILFQSGHGLTYRSYYRHYDGYPTTTGYEILKGLIDTKELGPVEAEAAIISGMNKNSEPDRPTVRREGGFNSDNYGCLDNILIEKASDIEWVYTVSMEGDPENRGFSIYKSVGSYANGTGMKPYISHIWGSPYLKYLDHYLRFMPGIIENKIAQKMQEVEELAHSTENMIKGYHRVNHDMKRVE